MDSPQTPESDLDGPAREGLAEALAGEAAFSGWSALALAQTADRLGLPAGEAERLFPGGPPDVLAWLSQRADQRTVAALEAREAAAAGGEGGGLRIRERITLAVRTRLEQTVGGKESVRRGLAMLALPFNAGLALRLLYRTVDAIWYAAGDTSADFNFYTKRATLAGVYSSTLLYWLNDRSEGDAATWAFLDRRIDDVMRFEKWKAGLSAPRQWASPRR
jgi:ubiquinone biosynthesis protein COQ9